MRIALFAAAGVIASLAACGGPQSSQANNAQANISNDSREENAAVPTSAPNAMAMLAAGPVDRATASRIMHERHEGMERIGKATKAIKRELDGGSPDFATIRAGAAQIADLSRKSSGWFPAGTGPDVGKTGAKPEIWQNPQDFAAKVRDFQQAATMFNRAAMSEDVNALKARFADLGQSCKACHDKYRAEMKH